MPATSAIDRTLEVADFLAHEGELLDARRFDAWLELYDDEALYWIPQGDAVDPRFDVSIAYDDRRRLHERVLRLGSGFAYSQDPPSRTVHVVGSVRVGERVDDVLTVTSSLVLAEVRRDVQSVYAARVEHGLVEVDGTFRIRRKVIRLANSDVPLGNVTFLI